MGTYFNVVHKSKKFHAQMDMERIDIYPVLFLCKVQDLEGGLWNRNSLRANLLQARLASMDAAWGNGGPEYVSYSSEKPEVGDWIYKVDKSFRTYIDSYKFPGEFVGLLQKNGKKWIIQKMTHEEAVNKQISETKKQMLTVTADVGTI